MPKTAQQATTNWVNAMSSATVRNNYIAGIQGFTGNPMQLAATPEAMQAYADGCANSVTSGRRAKGLAQTSAATWQQNAVNVGAPRLASGAQKAQAKYLAKITPYAALWPQMKAASKALPKGGLQNAVAKVQAALAILMQAAGTDQYGK